ncbi:unnamed protein product [Lactuca saligna]|uniref:Ubiquitin-like domain-containing protein n=1 Tax=Lactuca saligna TaxID=75948 RepID=A0AA35UWZ5_LACSI|nr:unnamed protein product [Lactuca saligna]
MMLVPIFIHTVKVKNVHATAATRPVILEIKAYLNEVPVPALKEQIASVTVTGVLSEQQRLICRGKVLKVDQLLSAYRYSKQISESMLVFLMVLLNTQLPLIFAQLVAFLLNFFSDRVIASIMSFPDSSIVERLILLLESNNEDQ